MNIDEVKDAFAEVRKLRQKAQEKEEKIVEQLVSDGDLTIVQALLLKGPNFGSSLSLTEALIMAALSDHQAVDSRVIE